MLCLHHSFVLSLFSAPELPWDTVLHGLLQRGSFPQAAALQGLLQRGSLPWHTVLQEQADLLVSHCVS